MRLLWIALGGGAGSVARYWIWRTLSSSESPMPYGTLAVNLAGCFAIGLAARGIQEEMVRFAVITGFLGGFTTYSAFGLETLQLMRAGLPGTAAAYVALSNVGGLAAAWLGWKGMDR